MSTVTSAFPPGSKYRTLRGRGDGTDIYCRCLTRVSTSNPTQPLKSNISTAMRQSNILTSRPKGRLTIVPANMNYNRSSTCVSANRNTF